MSSYTVRAATITDAITSKWRGRTAITVVANPSDLPITAPDDARGLYKGGETWIVANTQPSWQVAQTLAHEMLGHHAMRKSLGSKWRPFMHAIQDGIRAGDERLQFMRGEVRAAYVDHAGEFNLSSLAESDEIVAAVAEYGFDPVAGRLRIQKPGHKLATAAKGQFLRETLYLDRPATFEQLEGALVAAEHRLRHGGPVWGLGFRLRRWYASAMSKPWDPNQPPMSLRESENLLQAEDDSQHSWATFKSFGKVCLYAICLIFAITALYIFIPASNLSSTDTLLILILFAILYKMK
jgi:hypothetical protein